MRSLRPKRLKLRSLRFFSMRQLRLSLRWMKLFCAESDFSGCFDALTKIKTALEEINNALEIIFDEQKKIFNELEKISINNE